MADCGHGRCSRHRPASTDLFAAVVDPGNRRRSNADAAPATDRRRVATPPPSGCRRRSAGRRHRDLDEPPGWYQPTYWFGPSPWDTGIELGLNGSSGTSDSLSIQTGGYIKRESRFSKLDLDANYNRTTNGGAATQNNAQLDVRNDWLLDEKSPWTLFASGNVFYDEFQAFDLQTNAQHRRRLSIHPQAGDSI